MSSDHNLTFGDICRAIAEGQLPASVDGSVYHVNALELRRYLNKFRPLPSLSTLPFPESLYSSMPNWPSSSPTPFA